MCTAPDLVYLHLQCNKIPSLKFEKPWSKEEWKTLPLRVTLLYSLCHWHGWQHSSVCIHCCFRQRNRKSLLKVNWHFKNRDFVHLFWLGSRFIQGIQWKGLVISKATQKWKGQWCYLQVSSQRANSLFLLYWMLSSSGAVRSYCFYKLVFSYIIIGGGRFLFKANKKWPINLLFIFITKFLNYGQALSLCAGKIKWPPRPSWVHYCALMR